MFLDSLYCKHGVFKLFTSMKKSSLKCTYNVDRRKKQTTFPHKILWQDTNQGYITGQENFSIYVNPSFNRYFANSEDTDEMQYNAAFHQSLHCL